MPVLHTYQGMSGPDRKQHELTVLRRYHEALADGGVDTVSYDFETLQADYHACLWLSAVLYALPGVYDRGTTTEENQEAAKDVGLVLGQNLQPVLDAAGAVNSAEHLRRENRDEKSVVTWS